MEQASEPQLCFGVSVRHAAEPFESTKILSVSERFRVRQLLDPNIIILLFFVNSPGAITTLSAGTTDKSTSFRPSH